MIFEKLKKCNYWYLGFQVNDDVVSISAYFNDSKTTKDAGLIGELNIMRIINETITAAFVYGLVNKNKNESTNKNILIFELGGGPFDISVLSLDDNLLEECKIRGDTHLGGEDFDNILIKHCLENFKQQIGTDISNNQKVLRKLEISCEKCIKDLSSSNSEDIYSLSGSHDFLTTILNPDSRRYVKIFSKNVFSQSTMH